MTQLNSSAHPDQLIANDEREIRTLKARVSELQNELDSQRLEYEGKLQASKERQDFSAIKSLQTDISESRERERLQAEQVTDLMRKNYGLEHKLQAVQGKMESVQKMYDAML